MKLSRPTQLVHLITGFFSFWIPLTIYWGSIPAESWLVSPLWNSFYLLLMGCVVLIGWLSKYDSVHLCSLCLMCVYAISRAVYGTEPEYLWLTPIIDVTAGLFCWAIRQRVIAGIFALMAAHFMIAKFTGIPAWRWQLRNNLLYIIQCITAITLWLYPIIKHTKQKHDEKPNDNVLKLVISEGAGWPNRKKLG